MTYAYGEESERKLDVPRGQVSRHHFQSEIVFDNLILPESLRWLWSDCLEAR